MATVDLTPGTHALRVRYFQAAGDFALEVYWSGSHVKVAMALVRGKKLYDKRRAIAERDAKRDTDRAVKAARR